MVQTRKSSTLNKIDISDGPEPPLKKLKASGSGMPDVGSGQPIIDTMQDIKSSKSPHTLTPQAEVSDATTSLKRVDSPWKVGAHVSAAGGVENTVTNAIAIGANAFALFLKAHRKWTSPSLTPQSILEFKKRMKQYGYANNMVLPHGNYLINLGNPDSDKREKSYECFLDDLKRCEELGLELYNFHPGSTVGATSTENSIAFIAECINRAHKATKTVKTVMENMAGAGNVIGSKFSDLAGIIAKVEDKTRIGVCIDTCHAFAAGYDIKTKEGWDATMIKFDEEIGLKYLCGMHLNDSKAACNSKKDRHQNIGLGLLGFSAFQYILQDPRTRNIPLILETPTFEQPNEIWSKEIGILQAFTNAPGAIKSEDLNSLVQKLKSVVGEAELKSGKRKKVVKSAKLAKRKAD